MVVRRVAASLAENAAILLGLVRVHRFHVVCFIQLHQHTVGDWIPYKGCCSDGLSSRVSGSQQLDVICSTSLNHPGVTGWVLVVGRTRLPRNRTSHHILREQPSGIPGNLANRSGKHSNPYTLNSANTTTSIRPVEITCPAEASQHSPDAAQTVDLEPIIPRHRSPKSPDFHRTFATQNILTTRRSRSRSVAGSDVSQRLQ